MPAALVPVADHVAQVLTLADGRTPAVETVALDDAPGRVLAADLLARVAVPPFDNSAMDGFAVRRADLLTATAQDPRALDVVADLPAGSAAQPHVGPGQAARIMTGAPVPPGADAVVPVELTVTGTFAGGGDTVRVEVVAAPAEGAHVRRAADDVAPGDVVIVAGTRLTARHASAAASVGYATLDVVRRPRVHVLSTGAELRAPGEPLEHGQIPDSNSTLLAGLARAAGADVHRVGAVADDPAALRAVLETAAADADLIVTSGGVSAGAHDVVKELLSAPGPDGAPAVTFTKVAMQPGKPQGYGRVHGTPIVTLPGNPVSVFVSFEVVVRPLLRALLGQEPHAPARHVVAATGWRSPAGRTQHVPVVVDDDGVRPATSGGSGSHLVASLALAEALAVVPADVDEVRPGDVLTLLEIDR